MKGRCKERFLSLKLCQTRNWPGRRNNKKRFEMMWNCQSPFQQACVLPLIPFFKKNNNPHAQHSEKDFIDEPVLTIPVK